MRSRLPALAGAVMLVIGLLVAPAAPVRAAHVTFGEPEAIARLGQPVVFQTTLQAAEQPDSVELLVSLPADAAVTVISTELISEAGGWRAVGVLEGELVPNTRLSYRFRARGADHVVLGPAAETVLVDDRFEWRTLNGPIVRLHWYAGDESFAQRALAIGEGAIDRASALLGVTETEPIDFFIYNSEDDLRGALGAGTRENVGGQAHADIRTLFGLIEPHEVESDWVDTLVIHELTHLVFDTATDNPYHSPPRWLNEGVAVYLSEGYTAGWRSAIEGAAANQTLIPLDGLGGLFPTTADRFFLAYAESVSAVDFFIRTYDESTLWQLVRSYAEGVSDEEAFVRATGAGLGDFSTAWMESLGAEVPQPLGPLPGQPGPLPPGWDIEGQPAPGPTGSPAASPTPTQPGAGGSPGGAAPSPAASPALGGTPQPGTVTDTGGGTALGLLLALVVVAAIVALAIVVGRRQQAGPPPP